jgi:CrcB protein
MERFFLICFAGALGTGVRYLVGLWAAQRFGIGFPFGTLIVNVVGCFLIAVVLQLALSITSFPVNLRLALTTGFMGGLTTYSSFNYETTALVQNGNARVAALYLTVTVLGCMAAGLLGTLLARRLAGA